MALIFYGFLTRLTGVQVPTLAGELPKFVARNFSVMMPLSQDGSNGADGPPPAADLADFGSVNGELGPVAIAAIGF